MKHAYTKDEAFTGLEAAIVLIAFVVVAAVFSYVVLGAGFFTTQKSQEVVHTGVSQASSSLEVIGNVYGIADADNSDLGTINFTIGNTAGGSSIDMTTMVVSYRDATYNAICGANGTIYATLFSDGTGTGPDDSKWAIIGQHNGDSDVMLEPGEQFVVAVRPLAASATLTAGKEFTIELKPSTGAVLYIHRTVPMQIDDVNILN